MNFVGVQIIMERLFNLFSFDASDNIVMQTAGK